MRPTLFTIDQPGPGRLSTMAKPRGGDWLAEEMTAVRGAGVDVLVCALTAAELDEVDLSDEPRAANDAGLEFVSIPIVDRAVPDSAAVLPEMRGLAGRLQAGDYIVAHCRFGIGRASLLAAGILVLNGVAPEQAWQQLERARGLAVPDTRHSVNGRASFSTAHCSADADSGNDAVDVAVHGAGAPRQGDAHVADYGVGAGSAGREHGVEG